MTDQPTNSIRTIISFAARTGLPMGLYLSVISGCMIGSLHYDALQLAMLALMVGVPFMLWRLLRPMAMEELSNGNTLRTGSLWLAGIYCFLFAALITGLLTALYLVFIEPNFMGDYLRKAIESFKAAGSPESLTPQIDVIQQMLDKKLIPSPMEMVASMMWSIGFSGSVLSLIVAFLMTKFYRVGRQNSNII